MSELFILGFGAKSVVELFEDSVDIGEELRWAWYDVFGWIWRKYTIQYRAVFWIRIRMILTFLGLQDLDPDPSINRQKNLRKMLISTVLWHVIFEDWFKLYPQNVLISKKPLKKHIFCWHHESHWLIEQDPDP
jgi:hypothetical protein